MNETPQHQTKHPRKGLRVPTGILLAIGLLFAATPAVAADAPATLNLVTANTPEWKTRYAVECLNGDGCTFAFTFQGGSGQPYTFAYGDIRYLGGNGDGISPVTVTTSGSPAVTTLAEFKSPINVAQLELPPIGYTAPQPFIPSVLYATWLAGSKIENDDDYTTSVYLDVKSDAPAPYVITVYDGTGKVVAYKNIQAKPGFNFIENLDDAVTDDGTVTGKKFHEGRITIASGAHTSVGSPALSVQAPVAGVAFVNLRTGGAPRVVPLNVYSRTALP